MDLILRGGQIIDGSGAPAFRADVGIEGDTIAALGDLTSAPAARIVDVVGLTVAPGFIDMHSHSDLTLPIDPTADSKVRQGITTEVIGQCGISPAPVTDNNREEVERYWSEATSGVIGPSGRRWATFGDFMALLRGGGLTVNIISLVGHGAIRAATMGTSREAPDDEELRTMQELLAGSMRDGAWGLSTGLIYAPGIHATTAELIALAKVAAANGGSYFSHIRSEGDRLIEAIEEAITIGRSAQLPVQISHFKAAGRQNWGKAAAALGLIEQAQAEGLNVTSDIYPYIASGTNLSSLALPPWARAAGPGLFAQSLDPTTHRRLADDVRAATAVNGRRWDEVYIARCRARPDYEGLNIAQLAGQRAQDPVDALLGILEETRGRVAAIATSMSEDNMQMGLSHPIMMIGTDGSCLKPSGPLSAGKLHPRSYGTFPRVLGRYVRELGLITLSQAIHKMTGLPAAQLGLTDRGRVAIGGKADITVFDPETVIDTATYAEPYQYPTGIAYVVVNGQIVVEGSKTIDCFPGNVLTRK